MSRFTQPVIITHSPGSDTDWVLVTRDLLWEVGYVGSGVVVEIPAGFTTDLASVPRIFWPVIPPHGRHTNASILHDWLYRTGDSRGRKWADQQFHEAMLALETPKLRASVMFWAVRVFGRKAFLG